MDVAAKLNKLAEDMGAIVVLYADDPNGARDLVDELCSNPKRKKKVVQLNLTLLLAWGAMMKASQLLGEYPAAVQAFTDRMCEAVYHNLGKSTNKIEPLLYDRWAMTTSTLSANRRLPDKRWRKRANESLANECGRCPVPSITRHTNSI